VTSDRLTAREHEALRHAANGDTYAETGRAMHCSSETVRGYFKWIRRRLVARNKAHAVAIGYQRGLLP